MTIIFRGLSLESLEIGPIKAFNTLSLLPLFILSQLVTDSSTKKIGCKRDIIKLYKSGYVKIVLTLLTKVEGIHV